MRQYRSQRMSSLFKEELNKIIKKELEFEGAVVTILDIEVDKDLEEALVKIVVFPSEKGPDVLLELLNKRARLQFLLLRKVNVKPMPKIIFKLVQ